MTCERMMFAKFSSLLVRLAQAPPQTWGSEEPLASTVCQQPQVNYPRTSPSNGRHCSALAMLRFALRLPFGPTVTQNRDESSPEDGDPSTGAGDADFDLQGVCRSLQRSDPELTDLKLDGSLLSRGAFTSILDSLRANYTLQYLTLRQIEVTLSDVLAPALIHSRVLGVTCQSTDDSNGELLSALSVALFCNHGISNLELRDCNLGAASIQPLGFLVEATTLQELRICHTESAINPEMALTLAHGLRHNTFLRVLDFTGCGLDDGAVRALSRGLQSNEHLEFLTLDFNAFGDPGMESLSSMLAVNRSLVNLHMFGNRVSGVGAEHLARALHRNDRLKSLVLSFNRIGDRGAVALAQALTKNTTLHNLWFPSNSIGQEGMEAFARFLPKMDGLEQLHVGLLLDCKTEEALTIGLKSNLSLSILHMEKPVYGEEEGDDDDEEEVNTDLNFYLRLNRSGRRLLRNGAPPALWSTILARTSDHSRIVKGNSIPDVLYYLLREIPEVLEHTRCLPHGDRFQKEAT